MKTRILSLATALLPLFFISTLVQAQSKKTFAITSEVKGQINWTILREIDPATGAALKTIYTPSDKAIILDAFSHQQLNVYNSDDENIEDEVTTVKHNGITSTMVTYTNGTKIEAVTAPTESMVAASAYDEKTNRLFYTPMHSNELRFFDLSAGNNVVYYVRNNALKSFQSKPGEADIITRMCFNADGYGYALTNDCNHLIRFSSGNNITIADLGAVNDGKGSGNISVRNQCTSWGGDLVADANNNLYMISMKGNVFKINTKTLTADFMGKISNIPADFTINGAAVNDEGKVIVSCATKADTYYSVDMITLDAQAISSTQNTVYNASDLASSNLLFAKSATNALNDNGKLGVYPNPVTNRTFNVTFDAMSKGNYTVTLVNTSGFNVMNKVVNVTGKSINAITLPGSIVSGMYVVNVFDASGKQTYTTKLLVK